MSDSGSREPLALHGGAPAFPAGAPDWPPADPTVRDALEQMWADGSWGRYHGPHVERLTEILADWHQVPHAWLCCSGTFAVELALRALQVRADDEVILSGYDFGGNFRAIEDTGAIPVLVDIESTGWRLNPSAIEAAIGDRTRGIVASHLHGDTVNMPELRELADRRGLWIVEDACQAIGGTIADRPAGTWGDVGVLSFGGSKLLTAGRGGAILTRRPELLQRAKNFCERGNNAYPLSEMQAAVLLPQLGALRERHARRQAAVTRLTEQLGSCREWIPAPRRDPVASPAYYKLGFQWNRELAGASRSEFLRMIQAEGVAMDAGFRSFSRRSTKRCRHASDLRNSHEAAESTIVLHHPILLESNDTIDHLASAIRKVLDAIRRMRPDR